MKSKKRILACTVCGQRNYSSQAGTQSNTQGERLELKKYCKHCGQHTLHRETK